MIAVQENRLSIQETGTHDFHPHVAESGHSTVWPVWWSAVQVGALAAIAAILILGLVGTALGVHVAGVENRVVDLRKVGLMTVVFSIFSAFLSYVLGGWVAGKIGGFRRSEPAMLHGAIAWLATIPVLVLLIGLGAGSYLGSWYGGLAGSPSWASQAAAPFDRPEPVPASVSQEDRTQYAASRADYESKMKQWRDETPRAARNAALGAVTALLLGLVGSVIGGWMSCSEPMTFRFNRSNERLSH